MAILSKRERVPQVWAWLEQAYPEAQTELHYADPYQLLVAVILSAQCTDARVNMTTPAIFSQYPTVQQLAQATADEVFLLIKSISYPNNKARHLVGMAQRVVAEHGGQIPDTREGLEALPGVGRKTANVLLSVAFAQEAMAVDTHVFRVSQRLGLARGTTPRQIEEQLMRIIPAGQVHQAHHWLILHGRYVCKARTPDCAHCGLLPLCPYGLRQRRALGLETPNADHGAGI